MAKISSETQFIWKLIKDLLFLPITFILIIFRKREFSDLLQPIRDLREFLWEAKVTSWLIVINVIIYFCVTIFYNFGLINEFFIESYLVNSPEKLLSFNVLPIIGSWFMHGSFYHLIANMLFLFILGRVVEKYFGPKKMLLIYFGAAIVSTVIDDLLQTFVFLNSNYASLGASGAISGLGAAAMLISPFYLTYLVIGIPLPIVLVVLLQVYSNILGIMSPVDSNIAYFAHLAGYFSIALLIFLMNPSERSKMKKGLFVSVAIVVIFLLVNLLFPITIPM